ncbi:uncharacterized protein MYCFIDRAFT_175540 [Pseudocercospora fijiensis CIRAD86]|uniref:Uncharacterized protein n=1 Tax=Pseudocercospora fijiensis (strain CIRAD86) TaxID=383855 RepID=M2ZSH3_PSEFD|nr:uncharacterized protein MYCFIDRAFT_175540 [Pseudocercospora fijiensis CIRAD86]EME81969.1 hypothetical protein MYCFIDRAFT_175540 [Pseudocercospora fijiensis CIRAD86]
MSGRPPGICILLRGGSYWRQKPKINYLHFQHRQLDWGKAGSLVNIINMISEDDKSSVHLVNTYLLLWSEQFIQSLSIISSFNPYHAKCHSMLIRLLFIAQCHAILYGHRLCSVSFSPAYQWFSGA